MGKKVLIVSTSIRNGSNSGVRSALRRFVSLERKTDGRV